MRKTRHWKVKNNMNKVEKEAAERTVHCGRNDSIILSEKSFGRGTSGQADVSGLSGTFGLCETQKSEMSVYGTKDILREL